MILALAVLVPVLALSFYFYVRAWKAGSKSAAALSFDGLVILLGAGLCWGAYRHFYEAMEGTPDRGWWPVMTVLSCLVIYPAVLSSGAVLRRRIFSRARDTRSPSDQVTS